MDSVIFEISGEKSTLDTLMYEINEDKNFPLILKAERGSGKTTVIKKLSNYLENNNITYYVLNSNVYDSNQSYAPILNLLNTQDTLSSNSVDISFDSIPYIGSFLNYFSQKFLYNKRITTSATEQAIILSLEELLKKNIVYLICEDFDQWDELSILLFNRIIKHQINLKHQQNIRLIVTLNKGELISGKIVSSFHKINMEEISVIASRLNINSKFNIDEKDFIYKVSKGNLELIINCLNLFSAKNIFSKNYYNALCERIKIEKKNYNDIISLLKHLSIIGKKSRIQLLEEYYGNNDFNFTLEDCISLELLEKDEKMYTYFFNELIYQIIKESTNYYAKSFNIKLIVPFKKFYPAKYRKLATFLYQAGMIEEANKNVLFEYLLYFIDNNEEYPINENELCCLSSDFEIYSQIIKCYILYHSNQYEEALKEVDCIHTFDVEWNFEIDYLKFQILTNAKNTVSYFEECKNLMQKYVYDYNFKNNQTEKWIRAVSQYIDINYELETNLNECKKLKDRICLKMMELSKYDEYYCFKLSCLDLKSNIYHKYEIADNKLFRSNTWLSTNKLKYPLHYYISLLNYSGSCLILGEYERAYTLSYEALQISENLSSKKFLSKKEILFNNYLLSSFLAQKHTLDLIISEYENCIPYFSECADYLLMKNNLVTLYFYQKNYNKAFELSYSIYNQITLDSDVYYAYFISNNYLFLNYIYNDKIDKKAFDFVINNSPNLTDKAYFFKRNELIKEIFTKRKKVDYENNNLCDHHYIGKCWKFLGKCLLFSDLQTWSDC